MARKDLYLVTRKRNITLAEKQLEDIRNLVHHLASSKKSKERVVFTKKFNLRDFWKIYSLVLTQSSKKSFQADSSNQKLIKRLKSLFVRGPHGSGKTLLEVLWVKQMINEWVQNGDPSNVKVYLRNSEILVGGKYEQIELLKAQEGKYFVEYTKYDKSKD